MGRMVSHRDADAGSEKGREDCNRYASHHDEGDEAEDGERDDEARALDVAAIAP